MVETTSTSAEGQRPVPPIQPIARSGHVAAPKFTVLQQLRGLNALLVVAPHTIQIVTGWSNYVWDDPISIDTFFVVGGFMMFYSSRDDYGHKGATSDYYARRFARIVPLYWLCTAIFIALKLASAHGLSFSAGDLACSLTFLPCNFNPVALEVRPVYGVGWFLDYLLFYDIVFGFFLLLPRRAGALATSAVLISLVLLGLFKFANPLLAAWTVPAALKFAAGIGLGYLYLHRERLGWSLKTRMPLLWFAAIFAVAFLCTALGMERGASSLDWRPLHSVLALLLAGTAVFIAAPKVNGAIARLFHAFGDASYSIYLSHPLLLMVTYKLWLVAGLNAWLTPWAYGVLIIPSAALFGCLVYRTIEAPMTAWLLARWRGRQAIAAA
jgi:peptidoglycan/LPS O-acetylase OafA/YrhL